MEFSSICCSGFDWVGNFDSCLKGCCCFTRSNQIEEPLLISNQDDPDSRDNITGAFVEGRMLMNQTNIFNGFKKKPIKYHAFISHVQREAADVCQLIAIKLQERNLRVWIDMEADNLNIEGMLAGVAESATFIIYATQSYLTRRYCCFELLVALELQKPIQIIWEQCPDRNGFLEFKDFAQTIPECYSSILKVEAIQWQRREPYRTKVIETLGDRLQCAMPLESWSADELAMWVVNLGENYISYKDIIKRENITGDYVARGIYGERELIELGVGKVHARIIAEKLLELASIDNSA